MRRHSEKPELVYDLIELSFLGPRLELFARRRRQGWDAWGDQVSDAYQMRFYGTDGARAWDAELARCLAGDAENSGTPVAPG